MTQRARFTAYVFDCHGGVRAGRGQTQEDAIRDAARLTCEAQSTPTGGRIGRQMLTGYDVDAIVAGRDLASIVSRYPCAATPR